ncbi:MAG TPA: hypothetical protein VGQ41_24485 [Pyrinomonadaceae bacterium]|jgi:hypothetical protein|nr:hypothetical protein [Pyrinomonadaceae bacterium]
MKRTTSLAVVFVMTLALSMPVFGGDMPGPGAPQKPHGGNSSGAHLAIGEPLGVQAGAGPSEATPDLINQAMIIAIELMLSLI